jgi:hypothetical protein
VDGLLLLEYVSCVYVALLIVYLCFARLNMALELAKHNAVYEDIASKFFEVSHYRQIYKHARSFCPSTSSSLQML